MGTTSLPEPLGNIIIQLEKTAKSKGQNRFVDIFTIASTGLKVMHSLTERLANTVPTSALVQTFRFIRQVSRGRAFAAVA